MIQIYPAEERFKADHGWLQSMFSFSFAEYYDPENLHFGCLRVLNDDIVQPLRGFGAHPHAEMEIVSIVLKGYLKHEDSTGHTATTTFGGVQRMSAGTGIVHSEVNPSKDEEVNFLQLWFLPEQKGIAPSYQQTQFDLKKLNNQLLPIVSKNPETKEVASINQDLTIYLSDLEEGQSIRYSQAEGRKLFLFVIEGSVQINGTTQLQSRDSVRMTDTTQLDVQAVSKARFMLIDLS